MENDGLSKTQNSIGRSHIDPENNENMSETNSGNENLSETNSSMANDGLRETQNSACGSHIDPENDKNLSKTSSGDENLRETNSAEDLAYNTSSSSSSHSDAPQINGVLPEVADLEEELINTIEENEALDAALYYGKITAQNMERLIESLEREKLLLLAENQKLNLKLDIDAELNRKLEANIENATTEAKLSEENSLVLHDRLLQMEIKFKDKVDEHDKLAKKYNNNLNTSSCKIKELKNQVNKLQLEVDSLKIQKSELEKQMVLKESEASTTLKAQKIRLEMQIETQKQESSGSLAQAENQKIISESLWRKFDEQKKTFDKLTEQHKENEASAKIKLNQQKFEIHKLKEEVDDSKGKLKYSAKTMQENEQKSDAEIQLLNKELQEVRKLLAEREDSYQIAKQWVADYSKEIEAKFKDYDKIANNLVTKLNRDKAELEVDLKEKGDNFELKASREIAEKEQMRKEMKALQEKNGNLELKAREEEAEKENVAKYLNQLARQVGRYEELLKEKEERVSSFGDEKREALKQLCLSIEYHRNQCDDLKAVLSKTNTARNPRCPFCCLHC